MPRETSVLEEARELIGKRLGELDDERRRLERALAELGSNATRRGGGRPRGSKVKGAPKRAAGRARKGRSGGRADQAVALIERSPGINASGVAKQMKVNPNYLYRVLGDLQKSGRVKKDGRRYYPAGKSS